MDEDIERKIEEAVQAAIALDPYLAPYKSVIRTRQERFYSLLQTLTQEEVNERDREVGYKDGLDVLSKGYETYGIHDRGDRYTVLEWAPSVKEAYLTGDFNGWDRTSHRLVKDAYGKWHGVFMKSDGTFIPHNSRIKV